MDEVLGGMAFGDWGPVEFGRAESGSEVVTGSMSVHKERDGWT